MNEPTTATAAEPSELAIKLLTKMAKSTKGVLPIAELLEIAPLIGWRISRTTIPRAGLSATSGKRVRAALEAVGLPGSHTTDYAWTYPRIEIYTRDLAAQGRTALASTGAPVPKGAKPPTQVPAAEHDAVFVRVDPHSPSDPHYVRANVWTACDGYLVEGPDGPLGAVWIEYRRDDTPTGMADRPAGFWTWAYKAGLARLAAEALTALGDVATRRRRPEHPAGDEHTGICQICGRRQKLKGIAIEDLTMVDHGYHHENTGRSGRSWSTHGCLGSRIGSCYGVGYKPWEIDSSRLRWYRDTVVEPAVKRLAAYLKKLRAGEVKSIHRSEADSTSRLGIKFTEYTPESKAWPKYTSIYDWDGLVRWETDNIEQELKLTRADLAALDKRLNEWKRTPLYDELHPPAPAGAASANDGE